MYPGAADHRIVPVTNEKKSNRNWIYITKHCVDSVTPIENYGTPRNEL